MKYILLIYDNEATWDTLAEAERNNVMAEYRQFGEQIRGSGHYSAGAQLQPIGTATSVRVRDGKPMVTHGPFAETREQLGGYYVIEAANLDEATAIAARIPSARTGTIEVRPQVPPRMPTT